MAQQAVRMSPQHYARLCGVLYLYIIVAGTFAELFVRSRLIVPTGAAATARNIMAKEFLFRLGFSGELLHLAFDVVGNPACCRQLCCPRFWRGRHGPRG